MPKYDSPLGSKNINAPSLREFDVSDESEMQPIMRNQGPGLHGSQPPINLNAAYEFQQKLNRQPTSFQDDMQLEREIKEAKVAKITGKERLNEGARRRIEMLVGMTRSTREVDLEGNKFLLQTLRSREMREAIMAASEYDNTVQSPFEVRRQLLARSLVQVAGIEVGQFLGTDALEARLALVDDLDEAPLNRLYSEYLSLVQDSREKFAIKTPEDAKEVVEDLKK
jgi:hypothetical protein